MRWWHRTFEWRSDMQRLIKYLFNVGKIMNHPMQSSAVVLPNAHGYISYPHRRRPAATATGRGRIYVARYDRSASVNGQPRGSLMTRARSIHHVLESKARSADRTIHKAAAAAPAANAQSADLHSASAPSITAVWRLSSKQPTRQHRWPFVISFRRHTMTDR